MSVRPERVSRVSREITRLERTTFTLILITDHRESQRDRRAHARFRTEESIKRDGRNYSRFGSPVKGWCCPLPRATSRCSLWSRSATTDKWIKRLGETECLESSVGLKRQAGRKEKRRKYSEGSRKCRWSTLADSLSIDRKLRTQATSLRSRCLSA